MLATEPSALQLRYLQTVAEIATENNSTTIFPIPIDMIKPFMERTGGASETSEASKASEANEASRTGGKSLPAPDPTLPQIKVAQQDKEPA